MKCMSCESEINPKWKHAIDSNVCPFCGDSVMEEKLKDLFSNLRLTMNELTEYPDQLHDWLLSNYGFISTDSPKIVDYLPAEYVAPSKKPQKDFVEGGKFTVKIQTEQGEQEVEAEKIQNEERTNSFFKRAEAVRPNIDGFNSTAEKTKHLKSMANQIKKAGTSMLTGGSSSGYISAEMMEQADPAAIAEMQSLMSGNEIASSLPISGDDNDDIPDIVLQMANKGAGMNPTSKNAADLLKLQQMQQRVQNSKMNFESGENRGKGGFSRSG